MRKITILMMVSFLLVGLITPTNEAASTDINEEDIAKDEGVRTEIELYGEYIDLIEFKLGNEDGKVTGTLNDVKWKAYENLDEYIYINGTFQLVDLKWEAGKMLLHKNDFETHFNVAYIADNTFEFFENSERNACKTYLSQSEIIKLLEDPSPPIESATITVVPGQLPGATRDYRNGFHEGFDWYSGAIGIEISKETQVTPIYAGEIVRIDHGHIEPEMEARDSMLYESSQMERTPQDILDVLRGMQVWVQSENNVLIRYAHLDAVNPMLKVGDKVSTDVWIGNTGNSGTKSGVLNNNDDIHLHTDILICGENFWEYGDQDSIVQALIELYKSHFEYGYGQEFDEAEEDVNNYDDSIGETEEFEENETGWE